MLRTVSIHVDVDNSADQVAARFKVCVDARQPARQRNSACARRQMNVTESRTEASLVGRARYHIPHPEVVSWRGSSSW